MKAEEYIEQFINEAMLGKSPNTIKAYKQSLLKFAEWLEGSGTNLQGYARTDVQQYIAYMQANKRAASGVNLELAAIKVFSRYVGKMDAMENLRVIKAEKATDKAPKWLERTKVNTILRETDRKSNKRDHAIVQTLLNCGLRVSELVSLDIADYEASERKGSIRVVGKGNKERYIPLNADVRHAINAYLAQRSDSEVALFLSAYGKRISVRSVQAMLQQYGVHPHQLRHTFVKRLIDTGADIPTIQLLTGHSNAEMVTWYARPSEDDKRSAIEEAFGNDYKRKVL
ncbi:tyrosine-type recombinase/integrase [Lysinibacillus sphaericus]|uniref:tyrosine-type recombinase/integrase n=1 Tax=Lysinibacillus sphaericus TaxID=1421 RepID=UPI002163713D|nr:tyrosine-type recombinase/integrase [Lysinibacillus sphaericus]MCS1384819.1 tyrosine-type recombinase/integrase [Lysinibacillus sphaericus]